MTDPKNSDYTVESGASRNYEPWREEEESKKLTQRVREEEERGNAIKALENRQIDSKREMDVLSALDELRSLNARKQKLSFEQVLSALKNSETETPEEEEDSKKRPNPEQEAEPDDDEEEIKTLFYQQRSKLQRLTEPSGSDEDPPVSEPKPELKPAPVRRKTGRLGTGLKIKVKKK